MNKKSGEVPVELAIFATIIIGLCCVALLFVVNASKNSVAQGKTNTIIENCEYFQNKTYYGFSVYTHKGSCTNCWERMKELIIKSKLGKE